MTVTRRRFLVATTPAAMALIGCRTPPARTSARDNEDERRQRALLEARSNGAKYLASRQAEDGCWKSDVYGPFKFGDALTPLCLRAYLTSPHLRSSERPVDQIAVNAASYLSNFATKAGNIEEPKFGFEFATYTAALSALALSNDIVGDHRSARDAWLKYLRERQLDESLGWTTDDREYGGWGYCRLRPRKPKNGELVVPYLESNLSATTFGLTALHTAGVANDDPAFKKAAIFVKRCQNWAPTKDVRDPSFDDGGFHFIYDDPVRNKGGQAGTDRFGRERFHSYGSTTADGIRCLDICGLAGSDHSKAAEAWMRRHFNCARHPGRYGEQREMDREAVYYYYAASLAQTKLEPWTVRVEGKEMSWKQALAAELLARQKPDGSWANRAHAIREDDPLTATSLALIALSALG